MQVAVYGSLRKGFHNNGLFSDCKYEGEDIIKGYDMYSLGPFPAIVYGDGNVLVEVYSGIDDQTLFLLDHIEGYRGEDSPSNMYEREKVLTKHGEAFIYVYARPILPRYIKVPSGVWSRKEQFYTYY